MTSTASRGRRGLGVNTKRLKVTWGSSGFGRLSRLRRSGQARPALTGPLTAAASGALRRRRAFRGLLSSFASLAA